MPDVPAASVEASTSARLRLRPLEERDLATVESWWNDPAILPLQTEVRPPRPAHGWFEEFRIWHANRDLSAAAFALERREDGALVGTASLRDITANQQSGTLGVMIGPPVQGQGLGLEATRLMVDYGFRMLPIRRIGLEVWGYNLRAQKVYERVGFTVEGRRREVIFFDGAWHDQVLMSILRSEWNTAE